MGESIEQRLARLERSRGGSGEPCRPPAIYVHMVDADGAEWWEDLLGNRVEHTSESGTREGVE